MAVNIQFALKLPTLKIKYVINTVQIVFILFHVSLADPKYSLQVLY